MRSMKLIPLVLLLACAKDSSDAVDSGDTADAGVAVPAFGADLSPSFAVVGVGADGLSKPRDLGFHPSKNELWVVNKDTNGVVVFDDIGTGEQSADAMVDAYGSHFMDSVSSIAWGEGSGETDGEEAFASCQESRNGGNDFMGPTLWPGDRTIFAKENQESGGKLGSHLDMLHQSPQCMGIAHAGGNAFWVFDGLEGALVYYDFQGDHGPGGEDHSDGIVKRYDDVELERKKNVPGHMQVDFDSGLLYIADTGNGRVLEVNTRSTTESKSLSFNMEYLEEFYSVTGVGQRNLVEGLDKPSGLVLDGETLFVGINGTGEIIAYTLQGEEIARIQTPAESLMGLEIGPDGSLWYVDAKADEVVRIDPS